MQAISDEQLIEWVAAGDPSCLGTLFERHHRAVYRYCRQLTGSGTQAEDLVQEVFLKILRKAGSFRRKGSFKAWLFNIARNQALDHLRKIKRRGDTLPAGSEADDPVDERSAEDAASANQWIGNVARALSELPIAVQEVIWLGRFEFDNYDELGQALGCKAATARVRMHRAMQQLNLAYESVNGAPIDA